MPDTAQRAGDRARSLEFHAVPLAIIDRKRVDREALLAGEGGRYHRIETARKEHYCDGFVAIAG